MSKSDSLDSDFVFVRTKKRKNTKYNNLSNIADLEQEEPVIDKTVALRRIESAKEEIELSDIYRSTLVSLKEGLQALSDPRIEEIVCFGLGHVSDRIVSRYQLALLLCLRNELKVDVFIQDPGFWSMDKTILKELQFTILDDNLEGKYKAKFTTLFYLPHCPKQLSNNLLWCNWGLDLKNCIIVSNSFVTVTENLNKKELAKNANFISDILPYTSEFAIINTFNFFEVFNDTAIHIFPPVKLILIPEDFWKNREEPKYFKMALSENLKMLRQLLLEVRKTSSTGKISDSLIVRYFFNQFRKFSVTDQQLCRAQDEMKFLCNNYICYLQSLQKYNEITENFRGKGERSIKETADMVGFKLPHDPK